MNAAGMPLTITTEKMLTASEHQLIVGQFHVPFEQISLTCCHLRWIFAHQQKYNYLTKRAEIFSVKVKF
jgi:hypothetical protein